MDFTRPNQSGTPTPSRSPLDSGAPKPPKPTVPDLISKLTPKPTDAQPKPPTPVTSAKAAINAMYAEQANRSQPAMVTSAREAVNAAAKQDGVQHTKSASNLHHGSIQRSMESTRTSASALLRRAGENDELKLDQYSSSVDPLAKVKLASAPKRPEREIPVVRTSLKLGASARPKPAPVVLPPNARMAQVARPVESTVIEKTAKSSKIAKFLRLGAADIGAPSASSINPGAKTKALASGQAHPPVSGERAIAVPITSPDSAPAPQPKRRPNATRDPQMLAGAKSRVPGRAQRLASRAQAAEVLGMATTGSSRFRMKPKGFTSQPAALPSDNAYIMSEPPKLGTKKRPPLPDDLGVIESYRPENPPQPIPSAQTPRSSQARQPQSQSLGDHAPTGTLQAQKYASGHVSAPRHPADAASAIAAAADAALYTSGRAASAPVSSRASASGRPDSAGSPAPSRNSAFVGSPEIPAIKAENTSNYSFSRRSSEPDNNRYALGGESPFLKSVNVEKRPLSDSPQKFNPGLPRAASRAAESSKSDAKSHTGRKNFYAKKSAPSPHDLPSRPTVIIPSSHRSNAPLFFLVVITVFLGVAVGAAAYLCFFQ